MGKNSMKETWDILEKTLIILEYLLKKLLSYRNKIARKQAYDIYYISWSFLKQTARKLTQEEINDYE